MRQLQGDEIVRIKFSEFAELVKDQELLKALKAVGVEQDPIFEKAILFIKDRLIKDGVTEEELLK